MVMMVRMSMKPPETPPGFEPITLSARRMNSLIDAIEGIETSEAIGMMCLMLSYLYQSFMVRKGMTILEFTDMIHKQVVHLIQNPPELRGPTPGCRCRSCQAKRKADRAKRTKTKAKVEGNA